MHTFFFLLFTVFSCCRLALCTNLLLQNHVKAHRAKLATVRGLCDELDNRINNLSLKLFVIFI